MPNHAILILHFTAQQPAAPNLAFSCMPSQGFTPTQSYLRNATSALSVRRLGKAICSSVTPQLYMSKRSGFSMRHSTGDRNAATGGGGGLGVWVLMMYCWGGAYLLWRTSSSETEQSEVKAANIGNQSEHQVPGDL